MKKGVQKRCAEVITIMKPSRASSNIGGLTRQFTQSGWRDLNSRPLDPQSSALPSCATARGRCV
jgi:hypothetical protein